MKLNTKELYLDLTKGLDPTPNQKQGITYLIGEYQNTLEDKDLSDLGDNIPDDWLEKYITIDQNDMINYVNQTLCTNLRPVGNPDTYSTIQVNQIMEAVDTLDKYINSHTQQI